MLKYCSTVVYSCFKHLYIVEWLKVEKDWRQKTTEGRLIEGRKCPIQIMFLSTFGRFLSSVLFYLRYCHLRSFSTFSHSTFGHSTFGHGFKPAPGGYSVSWGGGGGAGSLNGSVCDCTHSCGLPGSNQALPQPNGTVAQDFRLLVFLLNDRIRAPGPSP